MKKIDCRGLACPAPVLKTRETIQNENLTKITVMLDNEAAKQNLSRFLETQNFSVTVNTLENGFEVTGEKTEKAATETPSGEKTDKDAQKIMVIVKTDKFGHGDDALGEKLMRGFLKTLNELGDDLWQLVFINSGVKLAIEGSVTADAIKVLGKQGVNVLLCGTCLTHFNLMDKKRAGQITNMLDVVTAMHVADKVITI